MFCITVFIFYGMMSYLSIVYYIVLNYVMLFHIMLFAGGVKDNEYVHIYI